jgi:hypothetical protein
MDRNERGRRKGAAKSGLLEGCLFFFDELPMASKSEMEDIGLALNAANANETTPPAATSCVAIEPSDLFFPYNIVR